MERFKIPISDYFIKGKVDRLNRLDLTPWPRPFRIRCNIKVLVVTDSSGKYTQGGFGLNTFLKAFEDPLPYTSFDITKAHLGNGPNGADLQNFRFDNHNLDPYDVIFIFAVNSFGQIPDSELRALSEYMDQGGGVFATGDHADLGVSICGQLPRVKSMRRWYTPSNPGPNGEPHAPLAFGNNHDTIVDTNSGVPGVQGSQSDLVAQTISPVHRFRFVSPSFRPHSFYSYVKFPHPVLCSPDGVINRLPDHMHEGLCEVPTDLNWQPTFDGYTIEEYPSVSGSKLKPEIVAYARDHNGDQNFGVICALDGHRHGEIGRVLVDATWHHFFDINIQQFEDLKDLVNGGHTPNPEEIDALEAYNQIQHYYRNIAYWLARRNKQRCFRIRGWHWLLNHYEVTMHYNPNLSKLNKHNRILYFHQFGTVAKNALGDLQSECQSSALIQLPEWVFDNRFLPIGSPIKSLSYVDPRLFETVCLGCSLHELNSVRLKREKDLSEKEIDNIVEKSRVESLHALLDDVEDSIGQIKKRVRKSGKTQK